MNLPSPRGTAPQSDGSLLPLLLLLFVGSGCSALIYEIVWFQLLQLVIGSSAVSLGVLLGTFMGGMCLGSLLLPRIISKTHHPLRVYAFLELGIAVFGLVMLFLVPFAGTFYLSSVSHGTLNLLLRGALCAVCLLPPTILMGATLPAIARWMEASRTGMSQLGFFYGANIAGAVFGCLLTGFYLLRVHDVWFATGVAIGINVVIALASLVMATRAAYDKSTSREAASSEEGSSTRDANLSQATSKIPYLVIGVSGFTALSAEVVWTRQLSLLLGASVYTFSIILSVFLIGLCVGSSVGSMVARLVRSSRLALGVCQLGLSLAILWSCYALSVSLPYWPIDPSLPASPWHVFQLDLMRCLWVSFPATCLWGASFPLALAVAASRGQDPGRLVGGMYAANTVGAIVGSLGASLLSVAWLGTQYAQMFTIVVTLISAWLVLGPLFAESLTRYSLSKQRTNTESKQRTNTDDDGADPTSGGRSETGERLDSGAEGCPVPAMFVPVFLVTVAALTLIVRIPETPRGLIAYGRNLAGMKELPEFLFVAEGMNASIAVSEFDEYSRNFHVSGKVVASNEWQDMRLQRMLGHLPAIIHGEPKSVLIVGCGAGVTAGSFVVHPSIERIVICEIEPLIPETAGQYFGKENHEVMQDPRVEIIYDDARHFVATTDEKFDIITSDPIHPWVKGAAALYSKEYFESCKKRLNPGGIVTQWVPLYESNLEAVKSEYLTFLSVFPEGTVWGNEYEGYGYDVVMLGQVEQLTINPDTLHDLVQSEPYTEVFQSLDAVGFNGALGLLQTYAGNAESLESWLQDAQLNLDRNLRLQYLAGMGLNQVESDDIYQGSLENLEYPEELFEDDGLYGRALRQYMTGSTEVPDRP